jgi:cytochrome c peroxidase
MKFYKIIFILILASCSVDPEIKPKLPSNDIKEIIPEGWPQPVYRFENNTLTKEGFELGRELFYEEMLSSNNTISCGSCHQQFSAFANTEHRFSHGINDSLGNRNAPGLFNMNWNTTFMWDGGVNHIETQPLAPIVNPIEMNENLNNVVTKLSASNKYKQLFKSAFGSDEITSQKILKAFAQFQGVLYSYNSKYDQYKRNETSFTNEELAGYNLFVQKCNNCHREPLFTDHDFKNNGLPIDPTINDFGRENITGNSNDKFKFKTPSLRNIALTAPYMHDGRFNTLDQVLNHYSSGITNTTNLDPSLQSGINLSSTEKSNLKSFLLTLTDYKFIQDERFKDPN